MEIFKSATKMVLLMLVIALIILTAMKIVDPKVFELSVGTVLAFYFGQKVLPKNKA